ncbi:MAG: hypothetical protein ABI883_08865, partial [Chthoniobacterales bacterium]
CGLGHSGMKGSLVVDSPEDYQAWLKERAELSGTQSTPLPEEIPGLPPGPTPGTIPPPGAPKVGDPGGENPAATPGERKP